MINTYALIDWTQPEADSGLLWTQDSSPSVNLYNNHCRIHSLIYPPIHPSIQSYVSYLSNGFANPALCFSHFLNSSPIVLWAGTSTSSNLESHFLSWCFAWMNLRQEVVPYSSSVKPKRKNQENGQIHIVKVSNFSNSGFRCLYLVLGALPMLPTALLIQCGPSTWDGLSHRIVPCLGTW